MSVVIPTHRRRESLERLLRAIAASTLPPNQLEVIVSIDGSDDGTQELVEGFQAPFPILALWNPNRGRAAACNSGVAAARGELIVLLDDDMEPEPDCLEAHIIAHRAGPRSAILGAIPVALDAASPPIVRYKASTFDRAMRNMSRPDFTFRFRDVYTGHFSISRSVFLEVGGFEERFTVYGNEDHEISIRLVETGVQILYEPNAVARQHYNKDFVALVKDTVEKGRTAVMLASIHPETYDELKLNTYYQAPLGLRVARNAFLFATRRWPRSARFAVILSQVIERFDPPWMNTYYRLVLGYFYWVGAEAAMRENRVSGSGLTALRPPDSKWRT